MYLTLQIPSEQHLQLKLLHKAFRPKSSVLRSDVFLNNVCEVKVKLSLCLFLTEHQAMKAYWGSGDIAPLVL